MTDRSHAPWCGDTKGLSLSKARKKWLLSHQPWRVLRRHPVTSNADIRKSDLCSPYLERGRGREWCAPSETGVWCLCAMPRTEGEPARCKPYWRSCCLKVEAREAGTPRQSLVGVPQLCQLSARWKGQALKNAPATSIIRVGRYLVFPRTSTRRYV